jgi:type II secretory pathway pseudopilin PulG
VRRARHTGTTAPGSRLLAREHGASLIDLLFVVMLSATLTAMAVPTTASAIDEARTAAAARYVSGRIMAIRMDALRRSANVGLRFEPSGDDYLFAPFSDGNGDGVRTADIRAGVDPQLQPYERLGDRFPGVRFVLGEGVRDVDGATSAVTDGVRIGTARILTMSPDGTATSGTLYVRGRRGQFAVRILGITGRTRVLEYRVGDRRWTTR